MNDLNIPIVCTLNDAEFRERERLVLEKLKSKVVKVTATADGFAFRFLSDGDLISELAEFIILERRCCPFLDFNLKVECGAGSVTLELSGAEGAKEFIATTFVP